MRNGPSRRSVLAASFGIGALWPLRGLAAGARLGPPRPFSFDDLKAQALAAARRPYAPPVAADEALARIGFDAYQRLVSAAQPLPWDGPEVRAFPLGGLYREPVSIALVENGAARELLGSPGQPPGAGFAGFRVMNPDGAGDWLAFLGASYFRAPGPSGQYGLSARGLAIDTGGPLAEEFPRFPRFWLERGGEGDVIVHAQLDGPSVSGAYRIACRRTPAGVVQEIEAALYPRKAVGKLGAAPLTSMFWYGEEGAPPGRDWRPELHDSDGLAMWTGTGERVWRPLHAPPRVMTNAFADEDPRGFGLSQRDRDFDHYQDDGAFYDRRPSLWVEPLDRWGKGSVQLVEIPTADEYHDNIVAFWVPEQPVAAGAALIFRYRLHWTAQEPFPSALARVASTRTGPGGRPSEPRTGSRKFVIDLEGEGLKGLTRESGVATEVRASRGAVSDIACYPVVGTARWRLMFDLAASGPEPIDLRAVLRLDGKPLSETWIDQAFPQAWPGR